MGIEQVAGGPAAATASLREQPASNASTDPDTLALTEIDRQWARDHSRTRPQVPGYQTLEKLGQGAFGEVWAAREISTQAPVAIKFFRHTNGWQRLHEEIKQLAELQGDPNIVLVKDVAPPDEQGRPYYIMPRAAGSLADRIDEGPLSVKEALRLFQQVVRAMVFVHAKGIRHCDLKPGNILIEADGRAVVADFGQAHLSHDDSPALGTLFYMAPEQATLTEQIPDTAWDVYALGALFHAMVTGHPPRCTPELREELDSTEGTGKKLELYRTLVAKAPQPKAHRDRPQMDRELAAIIERCLRIDVAQRYPDARAIQYALERRERRLRRRPWLAFALVAPLLLLLAIGVAGWWSSAKAVEHSRQGLVSQLLESDLTAVRLVAEAVDRQLMTRQQSVVDALARKDSFADVPTGLLMAQWLHEGNRSELHRLADQLHQDHKHEFFRWSILDDRGVMQATVGDNDGQDRDEIERLIGNENKLFCYRGWFNGDMDRYDQQHERFAPLEEPHISHPYFGKANQTGVICFSAPIRDRLEKTVGVLAAQVTVADLAAWVNNVAMSNGCVALIHRRGFCVLHPNPRQPGTLLEPKIDTLPYQIGGEPIGALLDGTRQAEKGTSPELVTSDVGYRSPVDGKNYLAAMKVLPQSKWLAVVQHERDAVEQPVRALQSVLTQGRWTITLTSLTLILGLWGCLHTWLRREEMQSHA